MFSQTIPGASPSQAPVSALLSVVGGELILAVADVAATGVGEIENSGHPALQQEIGPGRTGCCGERERDHVRGGCNLGDLASVKRRPSILDRHAPKFRVTVAEGD